MSSPRRRKHHEDHEEHENHERWLVSYADMITVLMALFIVLFAMSNLDQTKFEKLKASLANSFGHPITAVTVGKSPTPGDSTGAEGPLSGGFAMPATTSRVAAQITKAVASAKASEAMKAAEQTRANVEAELNSLDKIRKAIEKALHRKGLRRAVAFRIDQRGLVVSVVTDSVVFPPNRAELAKAGRSIVDAIGPVLRKLPNDMLVEGHTDTVAAGPRYYPSEWELSSARAASVVRHLVAENGLAADRLSATGYADQRPLVRGTSAEANRVNRRVEIVVASTLPPQESALLNTIAPTVEKKS